MRQQEYDVIFSSILDNIERLMSKKCDIENCDCGNKVPYIDRELTPELINKIIDGLNTRARNIEHASIFIITD